MRRAALILIPFLAAIVVLIGGFYVYVGARTLVAGTTGSGLLFVAFGIGGIVLGAALWSLRRMLLAGN